MGLPISPNVVPIGTPLCGILRDSLRRIFLSGLSVSNECTEWAVISLLLIQVNGCFAPVAPLSPPEKPVAAFWANIACLLIPNPSFCSYFSPIGYMTFFPRGMENSSINLQGKSLHSLQPEYPFFVAQSFISHSLQK